MASTIKDVAKKANVSIATVSRILNDLPGYSPKTKKKVLDAIEELGYQPNAVARGLINKKTQTIGVLFPDVSSMLSSEILRGIENISHELGHSVIVCHTDSSGKRTKKYLQLLNEKRVEGILYVSEVMTKEYDDIMKKMGVPVVLISTESLEFQLPYVKVNDRSAVFSATQYMIQQGHQKLGMISGPKKDRIAGYPRAQGFLEALQHFGLHASEDQIIYTKGFAYEDGLNHLEPLLSRFPDLTGIIATSDDLAVGVISAAYKLGIKVPEQLSVIGYDNIKIAEMIIPPLTTVAQPLYEMGQTGAEMLFTAIDSGETVESRIMPHRIIERESVKKIK
ncbi:LacI family DNA-binding transcriptional regulator [Bacillus sp. RAR_GA_16]|uniref:LacI family DNA-binding transcriptional regulator n=1 Tax=Bacillus sp. RAR_GA_16 TaxID=2876774 RepID=UPI001CCD4B35|nr:LacI family DNA-binding transcriptional regulator [Bacillus sp. RAR_GA_16]MCA0174011.1 LacI family transcriptional regulator [Bacillus sp. RAR_GA_16]